jgi:hypothetical protein
MQAQTVPLQILVRAKQVEDDRSMPRTVVLDLKQLAQLFTLTLHDAAKELGVCATTLKK